MSKKNILYIVSGMCLLVLTGMILIYKSIFGISIHEESPDKVLIIPTGASYEQVVDSIVSNHIIKNLNFLTGWQKRKITLP